MVYFLSFILVQVNRLNPFVGFSPSDRSLVLQQFRNYGEVTRTVFPPNDSNWMHIQFLNSFQSGSALTKNGMVFNGRIMLGVVECTEKSLAEAPAETSAHAPPAPTLSAVDIMRPQQRSFHAAGRTCDLISSTSKRSLTIVF